MTGEGYKLIKNQDEYLKYQSDNFQKKILCFNVCVFTPQSARKHEFPSNIQLMLVWA